MSPPFGVAWEVLISGAALVCVLIGGMWKLANWKGGLDQWKKDMDNWKNGMDSRFNNLSENINTLISDVAVIKAASEKDATRNGMIQRHSPLVPSVKAIDILKKSNILSQVDANISYIQEEIEKRSHTQIYRDIEDREERFIEIAPGVIHALIKKGNIEEKKIDEAMRKLEKLFPVVTYYGVLLLIAAYILERGSGKCFIAKPSMIYSQIDMVASKDQDEVLASFDGDAEKAIKSLETSIRTLGELDNNKQLAGAHYNLGILLSDMGRKEKAETEYRAAIGINPKSSRSHNNLGILLSDMGRKEEAETEYRAAIGINPKSSIAHNNLGNLLQETGRKEDAETEYRDAIRINPDFAVAHANLGILYSETGKKEEAKKELEIAKELFEKEGREADVKTAKELLKSL